MRCRTDLVAYADNTYATWVLKGKKRKGKKLKEGKTNNNMPGDPW